MKFNRERFYEKMIQQRVVEQSGFAGRWKRIESELSGPVPSKFELKANYEKLLYDIDHGLYNGVCILYPGGIGQLRKDLADGKYDE